MKLHCISFVYSVHLNDVPIFHQFIVTDTEYYFFLKKIGKTFTSSLSSFIHVS